jgi:LacI family repressor for deo operon, udp, cdd, tsx, nupC, and nupG
VDVARLAGVSVATVSRALRGLPNVSPDTRDRVVQAAGQLEYTASPMASALVTGRTGSVGVLASTAGRWFFAEVLTGLGESLREQGYDLVLHVLPDAERRSAFFGGLPVRRRVDALAVVGLQLDDRELAVLHHLDVPIVTVGESLPGLHGERIDNRAAAALAVRHLRGLGHERIAMIGGEPAGPSGAPASRAAGFRAALPASSPVLEEDGAFTPEGGEAAMTRLLYATGGPPTAVFCQSDEMAFGALSALRRARLRCPEDVSVIGMDGHELAGVLDLTTVEQPVRRQGVDAGRWLTGALRALQALDRVGLDRVGTDGAGTDGAGRDRVELDRAGPDLTVNGVAAGGIVVAGCGPDVADHVHPVRLMPRGSTAAR